MLSRTENISSIFNTILSCSFRGGNGILILCNSLEDNPSNPMPLPPIKLCSFKNRKT